MSFFSFGSPPKRPPNARSPPVPFCTSPSQLQEVTLDQDASFVNTMAIKSPNSSMRGRSVKDIEEQLTNLRKENFNLKLRIYFLEEKMGSTGFTLDKDNVHKRNIDLQVQIATLQKDLKEKHDLLVEAVKAMELNDEEHKKHSQCKEDELAQVQQLVEDLRMQLHDAKLESEGMSEKSDLLGYYSNRNSSNEALLSKQERLPYLNVELQMEKDHNASMQLLMEQFEDLQRKYDMCQEESQAKGEQIKGLCDKNNVLNTTVAELSIQLGDFKGKLSKLKLENDGLIKKSNTDDKRMEEMFEQYNELKRKYSLMKNSLESSERLKVGHEMKINKLEYEMDKYKTRMKELQLKLEEAQIESKKNQNLAVSKSPAQKPLTSHTDDGFVSVSNPTTPAGTPKKDALHVPIVSKSDSLTSIPSSPDKFINVEELIRGAGENAYTEKILCELQTLKGEHSYMKQKVVKLKSEQIKACEIIKSMIESRNKATEEINQLKKQKQELERELESVVSKPAKEKCESFPLTKQIAQLNITAVSTSASENNEKSIMTETQSEAMEIVEHYRAFVAELESKIEVLMATVEENATQMHEIRSQYDELLKILQEKDNRIIDLEFELLSCNQDNSKIGKLSPEKEDTSADKQQLYEKIVCEKEKEIERLNGELKKCTCYLQEIVNKELWDKNREIEKLYKKNDGTSEVMKLRKELLTKDQQLKILKDRISDLGLDIAIPIDVISDRSFTSQTVVLQDQLKMVENEKEQLKCKVNQLEQQIDELHESENINSLETENHLLRTELVKCENLRKSSNDICNILGNRLEELATFLDSLLKQKSILGFLGSSKNRKIREIIDNTLDLSRSFTMNLSINPDQSLAQLSNISALLDDSMNDFSLNDINIDEDAHFSIVPANITLTYQSHLYKKDGENIPHQEQIIAALREQIFNLKGELQLRDTQLNELHHKEFTDKMTDTEEDKDGNGVCVKLFNNTSTTLKQLSEAHSESEAWSEPDRKVSRARIGLSQTLPIPSKSTQLYGGDSTEDDSYNSLTLSPSKRRQTVIELQQHISELEEELKQKTVELNSGDCSCNRHNIEQLESCLKQTEEKLVLAESRKTEVEKQLKQLQEVVDTLLSAKKELELNLTEKDKTSQNRINELEVAKDEALCKVGEFEKLALNAKNEVKVLERKLQEMQLRMDDMEVKLRKEYEECTVIKLKEIEEEFLNRIKIIEAKAHNEVIAAKDTMKKMEEEYARHYLKKTDVEKKLSEVETIRKELNNLKQTVESYEETIESYKRKEQEIVHQLEDHRSKNNHLRKELEEVTLQYSEAVLEKSKVANDKALIEQELRKIGDKEQELKQNLNQIQTELNRVSENYQDQISNFQKQKSKLEVKVSELESANADLYNKLVRLQGAHCDLNSSLPNLVSRSASMRAYKRQCSDQTYQLDDNVDALRNLVYGVSAARGGQSGEPDRQEVTSSPDLGIESDHGRFSSLETQPNLPRPIFQTVQLTESMKNILDGENNQLESVSCESEHCCQKSLEIIQENNELRRKLLRMKRALEDMANQLNLANQRKKQVEKTICKQIHKTSQVLRKAKANLDSGSESDVFKM